MSTEQDVFTATLEAFADTIIPGQKRSPHDVACSGAAEGGGAVQAGALELLQTEATGITPGLGYLAGRLNEHAEAWIDEHALAADAELPAFVGLPYRERVGLVAALSSPGHPEKELWVLLALFSNMAYDSAAHLSTADALAQQHPGLMAIGFSAPDSDGLWRFPAAGYGRVLARRHPSTTKSGSPA